MKKTKSRQKRVLVVGDVMLDHYVYGTASRISPEAPVPIIEYVNEKYVPGGAANVAANLASLGCAVEVFGVAGNDCACNILEELLGDAGVEDGYILEEKGRFTTFKERIVCGQQIVRVDRETRRRLTERQEASLLRHVKSALHRADAVVISDYAKGVVTQAIVDFILPNCARKKIPVFMNMKPGHVINPHRPYAIQVNRKEAFELAVAFDDGSWPRLREAAAMLKVRFEPQCVIITLGAEGIFLYRDGGGDVLHVPTEAKEVVDVSGAGDTVMAAFVCGVLEGMPTDEALRLANRAAGKVVAKHGTATVTRNEI